jgi:poly(3-hydroxybutyrate) depolymerase
MMWKLVFVLMVLIFLPGCPIFQDMNTPVDHSFETESETGAKYYKYVPSHYDPSKQYPLVITLHGTWPWDVDWHQINEWKMLSENKGFIVVAPRLHMHSTQGILPKITSLMLNDLKKDDRVIVAVRNEICRLYNINRNRIILSGFSSGGYPMYWSGIQHPNLFSAIAARSCNSDDRIFRELEKSLTKKRHRVPVAILIGKDESALQDDAWRAFRWLRTHGWDKHNCVRKGTKGGHLRRPERAYELGIFLADRYGMKAK